MKFLEWLGVAARDILKEYTGYGNLLEEYGWWIKVSSIFGWHIWVRQE